MGCFLLYDFLTQDKKTYRQAAPTSIAVWGLYVRSFPENISFHVQLVFVHTPLRVSNDCHCKSPRKILHQPPSDKVDDPTHQRRPLFSFSFFYICIPGLMENKYKIWVKKSRSIGVTWSYRHLLTNLLKINTKQNGKGKMYCKTVMCRRT
jgi:hypothetical protein